LKWDRAIDQCADLTELVSRFFLKVGDGKREIRNARGAARRLHPDMEAAK
jgi:hypothetical protein